MTSTQAAIAILIGVPVYGLAVAMAVRSDENEGKRGLPRALWRTLPYLISSLPALYVWWRHSSLLNALATALILITLTWVVVWAARKA